MSEFELKEVTLHGRSRADLREIAQAIYDYAMSCRYTNPAVYLLLLRVACQIFDQLDNTENKLSCGGYIAKPGA